MYFVAFSTIGLVATATLCDLRSREIPDSISIGLLGLGLVGLGTGWSALSPQGAFLGLLVGLVATLPWFYLGGIGGGDVKLLAALGTILGPMGLLWALLWTAITGGVLAWIAKRRGQADFAYVPAILVGVIAAFSRQLSG